MARSGFLADFQKFLMQGNVIDLAVAVIIGGAFGKIVTSFVEDIITPLILNPALKAAQVDSLQNLSYQGIKYGLFLASILNFLVIAFSIFVMIRAFEKAKRKFVRQEAIEEAVAPADPVVVSQERLTDAIERLTATMNR
ncbi:large conductance mechanosensitive channel protein [Leptolyngbya sp. NIES-3755]|nr:large conductance mechanosensitive channel protein [Leptolyngbya sp. NIES-3755]